VEEIAVISPHRLLASIAVAATALIALPSASLAQPVTIRVGHGSAAEEQLWLMKAKPDITPNQGKLYNLEFTLFRGGDTRYQAFEAGQLDMATGSGHSAIFAASQGMKFKVVAGLSRESSKGFVTQYMVLDGSPIKSIKDLKGKTIGNNAARSSIELWQRIALEKAGLNPNRDVNWAVVPFPSQGEAVRSGKLDLGAFPEPFATNEMRKGGMRTLFTSKDANPYDEDLMNIMVTEAFAAERPAVLRAFLADLVAATKYYLANERQAKQALLDSKLVMMPPEVFFNVKAYARTADCRVDVENLRRMQEDLLKHNFQKKRIDPASFVDLSFLPR
jgi:ABC-type nitrate/sulfonate/bicarbonate transport system substrate-binding protein